MNEYQIGLDIAEMRQEIVLLQQKVNELTPHLNTLLLESQNKKEGDKIPTRK